MKFEWKIVIFAVVCSLAFMFIFTYGCSLGQKTLYAYQVGIYKEASNKDEKLADYQSKYNAMKDKLNMM